MSATSSAGLAIRSCRLLSRVSEAGRLAVLDLLDLLHGLRKKVERARGGADGRAGYVRVSRRCLKATMAEQELDNPDVGSGLEQMSPKAWRSDRTVTRLFRPAAAEALLQICSTLLRLICSPGFLPGKSQSVDERSSSRCAAVQAGWARA